MECPDASIIDCENLCVAKPISDTKVTLIKGKILESDEEILVRSDLGLPCAGFGLFTGCNGGKREIFYYGTIVDNLDGTYLLGSMVRGLPFNGCIIEGSSELAFDHTRSEELLIGSTDIHYYNCLLCQCHDALKEEDRAVYLTSADLPDTNLDGVRAIVWNNGKPTMYVHYNGQWRPTYTLTGGAAEIGILGNVSLFCTPPVPNLPEVYNRGCTNLDELYDNLSRCDSNRIFQLDNYAWAPEHGSKIASTNITTSPGYTIPVVNVAGTYTADSFTFTPVTDCDLTIDLDLLAFSTARTPEIAGWSIEYILELKQGASTLLTVERHSSPNLKAALLNRDYKECALKGRRNNLNAGTLYTINIKIRTLVPAPNTYWEIGLEDITGTLLFSPNC